MSQIKDDPVTYSASKLVRSKTILPSGLQLGEVELGKGSNNRVVEATWNGKACAVRMPRRRSDTQQKGSATWEFRHTLRASQLGAAPAIYAAWYAKHATGDFPSGLYLVTECFPHDYEELLRSRSRREYAVGQREGIAEAVTASLSKLASADMFLYDLKPSNLVLDTQGGDVAVKIIDFGRDFCEWGFTKQKDAFSPVIDMVDRLVEGDGERRRHVLFASMLVQLAATTTHQLREDRHDHRMSREQRKEVNGIACAAGRLLDTMQGRNLRVLREVLRSDQVRGVLAHYHGRRNSGTRRTLRLARGLETTEEGS
jgi:hypothetical protein